MLIHLLRHQRLIDVLNLDFYKGSLQSRKKVCIQYSRELGGSATAGNHSIVIGVEDLTVDCSQVSFTNVDNHPIIN